MAMCIGAGERVGALDSFRGALAVVLGAVVEQGAGKVCEVVQEGGGWGTMMLLAALVLGGIVRGIVLLQVLEARSSVETNK